MVNGMLSLRNISLGLTAI